LKFMSSFDHEFPVEHAPSLLRTKNRTEQIVRS
jgi:hypothetical protein